MTDTPPFDFSQLTPAECILLAERLWEHARAHPESVPVPEAQWAEIERRLDAHERGETEGRPWEDVDAWLATL